MVDDLTKAFDRRIDALDVDVAGDQGQGEGEGEDALCRRRLPRQVARLLGARDRQGRRARQRRNARSCSNISVSSRSWSSRSIATEWWMTPQTVNAVNLPLQNALNFPAAILQPPYFDPDRDAAANYGAMGATIGHEISHSFDDQGSQFDAQGRLANWWTPQDLEHFKAAGEALAAQYDAYRPFPDLAINGHQVLSENIADLAGLAAAYDAYHLSLEWQAGRRSDDFFISFAQSWRSKSARGADSPAGRDRRPRAGRIPRRDRPQPRSVVQRRSA